jgi:hypothetical protein
MRKCVCDVEVLYSAFETITSERDGARRMRGRTERAREPESQRERERERERESGGVGEWEEGRDK